MLVYNLYLQYRFYKNSYFLLLQHRPLTLGQHNHLILNYTLETNIFGIDKNLYNKVVGVSFKRFIRPERKFKNFEYLKKQIKLDIKQAKK